MKLTTSIMAATLVVAACVHAQENTAKPNRAQWLREAQWGVFTHYLSPGGSTAESWNAAIDAFDVQKLADQVASTGAKYYVITIGQNSGFYLAPNATYDKYVGIEPSRCARRDLVSDIADAMAARGIRTMVYLPSGAPDQDPVAMEKLGWKPGKYPRWSHPQGGPDGGDPRLEEFQRKWEEIVADWAKRWGTKISGWWFDGCYYPVAMYKHPAPPNFASFAAAARAGNPDAIVAFNPGVVDPIITLAPGIEDYTAGEINDAMKVQCPGPEVDGAQYHMLSYLGPAWAQSPPRYSDPQVLAITKGIVDKGGAVTWDVPISPDGSIPELFLAQLRALGQNLAKPPQSLGSKLNPNVQEGLDVTVVGPNTVRVAPGTIDVAGRPVKVAEPVELVIEPVRIVKVRDEKALLVEDEPKGYGKGTGLKGCISVGTSLEGCLVPESLVVKTGPGSDAPRYEEGKDWRADKAWGRVGRIPGGAIGPDTSVWIDYDWSLMRLDTIEVLSDGQVVLRKGMEHRMCPEPPKPGMEARPLCNVFRPYHAKEVTADHIYPIGAPYPAPSDEWLALNRSCIPKTLEKLTNGGPFNLVFWGDSVTCGGDVSSPDKAFPQAFTAWLRNKYPQAQINYINSGTGGWNSDSKLPLFQQEILDKKPDLVVIEFVNDMGFDAARVDKNYSEAVSRIRAAGGEVVIVTPHFVRPDWMGVPSMRTHDPRHAVVHLREFAARNKVALADTSRRWEHLWQEGLPYMTLEYNGINHPDDRGHGLFVEELQRLFP